jgi:hypothetical protein
MKTRLSPLEINEKMKSDGQLSLHHPKSACFALALLAFLAIRPLLAHSEVKGAPPKPQSNQVVQDLSGRALIDRTLEVTGAIQADKWLELVETSTPTTPSTNHVRIWLNADGTQQTLKIIFDDGTIASISGN